MRNILKYLILVIVAAVFGHADLSSFSYLDTTAEENAIQSALYETSISASDSCIHTGAEKISRSLSAETV